MRKHRYLSMILVLGVIALALYGCGGGGGGGSDVTVRSSGNQLNASSQACAQCHASAAASYALSLHNTESAATCAQCHQPAAGHPNPTTAIADPDAAGICLNCHVTRALPHFNPSIVTTAFDGTAAAQYVDAALTSPNNSLLFPDITATSQLGCKACHNPHDTTSRMSIFRDYAQNSGHGDVNGEAWIHYRWKGTDRTACQRCHTTSGFISKITGGTGIVTFQTNDNTKQTLYCIGCHTNNTYAVRTTGAVTATYSNGATATFPDIGKSNLCMNCHTGRENGDSITLSADDFSNRSFINSHYLTGGSTVYASSGYEYEGKSYANPAFYEHDKIGTASFPTTGSGGPCVGCHMQPARHTFKPVTLNPATEAITAIVSNVCANCHSGGYALTVDKLNTEKEEFEAAMQALKVILATNTLKPMFFAASNPYFFKDGVTFTSANAVKNWLSAGDTDTTGATTGKKNMGAAFNYNMLAHDLGAFTHNRFYAKRLIYDSIDWIDDNNLNDSVTATINALPEGTTSYTITAAQKTAAKTYLGNSRP